MKGPSETLRKTPTLTSPFARAVEKPTQQHSRRYLVPVQFSECPYQPTLGEFADNFRRRRNQHGDVCVALLTGMHIAYPQARAGVAYSSQFDYRRPRDYKRAYGNLA